MIVRVNYTKWYFYINIIENLYERDFKYISVLFFKIKTIVYSAIIYPSDRKKIDRSRRILCKVDVWNERLRCDIEILSCYK